GKGNMARIFTLLLFLPTLMVADRPRMVPSSRLESKYRGVEELSLDDLFVSLPSSPSFPSFPIHSHLFILFHSFSSFLSHFHSPEEKRSECHHDITLEWGNDVGSGVYSSPLLADLLGFSFPSSFLSFIRA